MHEVSNQNRFTCQTEKSFTQANLENSANLTTASKLFNQPTIEFTWLDLNGKLVRGNGGWEIRYDSK